MRWTEWCMFHIGAFGWQDQRVDVRWFFGHTRLKLWYHGWCLSDVNTRSL